MGSLQSLDMIKCPGVTSILEIHSNFDLCWIDVRINHIEKYKNLDYPSNQSKSNLVE